MTTTYKIQVRETSNGAVALRVAEANESSWPFWVRALLLPFALVGRIFIDQ